MTSNDLQELSGITTKTAKTVKFGLVWPWDHKLVIKLIGSSSQLSGNKNINKNSRKILDPLISVGKLGIEKALRICSSEIVYHPWDLTNNVHTLTLSLSKDNNELEIENISEVMEDLKFKYKILASLCNAANATNATNESDEDFILEKARKVYAIVNANANAKV